MRQLELKLVFQLKNFEQDNSKVPFESKIKNLNVSKFWKRLLDCLHSRILFNYIFCLIGNSFLDGLVSIEKLLLPGEVHNTDVKTTVVLKTLVLLKYSQFVLPKYYNRCPYSVCEQCFW